MLDSTDDEEDLPKGHPKRFNKRQFYKIVGRGEKNKSTHHKNAMGMFKEMSQKGLDAAQRHMDGKAKMQSMQRVNTHRIELTNSGMEYEFGLQKAKPEEDAFQAMF